MPGNVWHILKVQCGENFSRSGVNSQTLPPLSMPVLPTLLPMPGRAAIVTSKTCAYRSPARHRHKAVACKFRASYRKTCAALFTPSGYARNTHSYSAMNEKIHLTSLRFEMSPATQEQIRQDLDQLLCQEAGVSRVDASFEGEYHDNTRIIYRVTLRAQLRDEVMFELKQGEQLLPTITATARSLAQRIASKTRTTAPV
jgi:hypothetical protein